MIKIFPRLDQGSQRMLLNVTCNMFKKYYPNLQGMIMSSSACPKGTEIYRESQTTAVISVPIPKDKMKIIEKPTEDRVGKVEVDQSFLSPVIMEVDRFVKEGLSYICKHVEFLPILDCSGGYSWEERKSDVLTAVENKRDFVLVDSYKSYLEGTKGGNYSFKQIYLEFGTEDYADVAIWIRSNNEKELIDYFNKNAAVEDWF